MAAPTHATAARPRISRYQKSPHAPEVTRLNVADSAVVSAFPPRRTAYVMVMFAMDQQMPAQLPGSHMTRSCGDGAGRPRERSKRLTASQHARVQSTAEIPKKKIHEPSASKRSS